MITRVDMINIIIWIVFCIPCHFFFFKRFSEEQDLISNDSKAEGNGSDTENIKNK